MATLYRFFLKGVIPKLQGSSEGVFFSNTLIHAIIFFKEIIRKSREISFSNEASAITKALVEVVDKIDQGDLSTSTKKPEYFEFVTTELNKIVGMVNDAGKLLELGERFKAKPASTVLRSERGIRVWDVVEHDLPGNLSKKGPRHDNDHEKIYDIAVVPSNQEILSDRFTYLPFADSESPNPLPLGPERLLDFQFRLLREDFVRPIKSMIANLLLEMNATNKLGKEKKFSNAMDDAAISYVYQNAMPINVLPNKREGIIFEVQFQSPNYGSRYSGLKGRKQYWEKAKRMQYDSLISLLVIDKDMSPVVVWGIVVERDIDKLSSHETHSTVSINVIEADKIRMMMQYIATGGMLNGSKMFLIETPSVLFAAYRPILEGLKAVIPSELPFSNYLAPSDGSPEHILPPRYARKEGFRWDLTCLLNPGLDVPNPFFTAGCNEYERTRVIEMLKSSTRLDPGQSEALFDCLNREVALVEGPPGTGKTFLGIHLVRVLLSQRTGNQIFNRSKLGPILVICQTNHALDQFLEHILDDSDFKIVRMGSRSKSEKIEALKLENVCRLRPRSKQSGYQVMLLKKEEENIAAQLDKLKKNVSRHWLRWNEVEDLLMAQYPEQYNSFISSPLFSEADQSDGGFQSVSGFSENLLSFWTKGLDLKIQENLSKPKSPKPKGNIFEHLGEEEEHNSDEENPELENSNSQDNPRENSVEPAFVKPTTNRPLEELLEEPDVWSMSRSERLTLHGSWKTILAEDMVDQLYQLGKALSSITAKIDAINDENRRHVLNQMDIIGVTTTGAAKFQKILQSVASPIIVCEEAAEVLESHVLTALSPSSQHLILIGDPKQLRPSISCYSLSLESAVGKSYCLDESMMERLIKNKLPSSFLTVQRRMRPQISELIRSTLYPKLVDGNNTLIYPAVRGLSKNLYFINHTVPQDQFGGDVSVSSKSHTNRYEVEMVVGLVKHLVRNGYHSEGDIAVLTPYLGQYMKLRTALSNEFTISVDARDLQELALMTGELEDEKDGDIVPATKVAVGTRSSLSDRVVLRTVDNFQGEEANIIIVSMVRSIAVDSLSKGSIGFLKSDNRTNVLLSRAKHGMYLVGNGALFETKSKMWKNVINMFREREEFGPGLPVSCANHGVSFVVDSPEKFSQLSPDGGCTLPCDRKLPRCGHVCTYSCHSDDPDHIGIVCPKDCLRLHQPCGHNCLRRCGEDCSLCEKLVRIVLPCGHEVTEKCYLTQTPEKVLCRVRVTKKSTTCEHMVANIPCHLSIFNCKSECGCEMACGHACTSKCCECYSETVQSDVPIERDVNNHVIRKVHRKCQVKCDKILQCGHRCLDICSDSRKVCSACPLPCARRCEHSKCSSVCSLPCVACSEKCSWSCEHVGSCILPCGSPCSRLPCNKRCDKLLACGHRCPGNCGEPCPSQLFCQICCSEKLKNEVVDQVMFTDYANHDCNADPLIFLPCGHFFAISTLDGILEMNLFYNAEPRSDADTTQWISCKSIESVTELNVPSCPNCRVPISSVFRYGRSLHSASLKLTTNNFVKFHNQWSLKINQALEKACVSLEDPKKIKFSGKKKKGLLKALDKLMVELGLEDSELRDEFSSEISGIADVRQDFEKLAISGMNTPLVRIYQATVSSVNSHLLLADALSSLTLDNVPQPPQMSREELISFKLPDPDRLFFFKGKIGSSQADIRIFEFIINKKLKFADESDKIKWIKMAQKIANSIIQNLAEASIIAEEKNSYKTMVDMESMIAEVKASILPVFSNNFRIIAPSDFDAVEHDSDHFLKYLNAEKTRILSRLKEKISLWERMVNSLKKPDEIPFMNVEGWEKIRRLENEINDLIRKGTEMVSIKEKKMIFKAMQTEFRGAGHFYQCPNGHVYTIGECGMAMETSRCAECGVVIGGSHHNLLADNSSAREFEGFYREN